MNLKILIVEDEMLIAESLKQMLIDMGHTDITVCRKVSVAFQYVSKGEFDLAILDINIEGNFEGIEIGRKCADRNVPFFYSTSYSDSDTVLKAKQTLPGSYVIKPFSPEEIMVALELTLMHHNNTKGHTDQLLKAIAQFDLSRREGEILAFVLKRLSTAEISEKLFLSSNTVKFHLKNLFQKTDTKGRKELIELFS